MRAVIDSGGEVVAVSVIMNVSPYLVTEATFGVPFRPLVEFHVPSYLAADCPMCKRGIPINVVFAHGKEFVESRSR